MVREKALVDEQTKLASMLNVLNKQTEKLSKTIFQLEQIKQESKTYLQGVTFDPMTISNYSRYIAKLQDDIVLQEAIIKNTNSALNLQKTTVKEAYIKVKSLENLKEKQKERYLKEIQIEEIKETDDIINSRRNIA